MQGDPQRRHHRLPRERIQILHRGHEAAHVGAIPAVRNRDHPSTRGGIEAYGKPLRAPMVVVDLEEIALPDAEFDGVIGMEMDAGRRGR